MEAIQPWAYSLPSKYTPGDSSACSHTKDFWEPGNRVPQPRECSLVFKGKGVEKRGGARAGGRLALVVLRAPLDVTAHSWCTWGHLLSPGSDSLRTWRMRCFRSHNSQFLSCLGRRGGKLSYGGHWRLRNCDAETWEKNTIPSQQKGNLKIKSHLCWKG